MANFLRCIVKRQLQHGICEATLHCVHCSPWWDIWFLRPRIFFKGLVPHGGGGWAGGSASLPPSPLEVTLGSYGPCRCWVLARSAKNFNPRFCPPKVGPPDPPSLPRGYPPALRKSPLVTSWLCLPPPLAPAHSGTCPWRSRCPPPSSGTPGACWTSHWPVAGHPIPQRGW